MPQRKNISKRHWGTRENTRLCGFCEGGTEGSLSIGVQIDKEDSTSASEVLLFCSDDV